MWPGNTADIKTLLPVTDRIKKRFKVTDFCVVADRGMISDATMKKLVARELPYILGSRMRKVNEIKQQVLSRGGRYKEVYPEGNKSKDPAPLKVKEVIVNDNRYIVCFNSKQARKDAKERQLILETLQEKLKSEAKSMIGNKGYRKYLKVSRGSITIDQDKVQSEARFDGKWVLKTNSSLSAEQVALKYKELWQVEHAFRDLKSVLETRPVFHKNDETIRGHVFCSYLALVLRKELDRLLEKAGDSFEWSDIKQDLKALQETIIEDKDKRLAVRSECIGTCGKVFQAVGVAVPPTIREV
jgi:transposase